MGFCVVHSITMGNAKASGTGWTTGYSSPRFSISYQSHLTHSHRGERRLTNNNATMKTAKFITLAASLGISVPACLLATSLQGQATVLKTTFPLHKVSNNAATNNLVKDKIVKVYNAVEQTPSTQLAHTDVHCNYTISHTNVHTDYSLNSNHHINQHSNTPDHHENCHSDSLV